MKTIRWNINNMVSIELTEKGAKVYEAHYSNANLPRSCRPPRAWPGAVLRMPMHEVMNVFGHHTYPGADVCFRTTVEIEIEDPVQPLAAPTAKLPDSKLPAASPPADEGGVIQRLKDLAEECCLANDIIAAMAETATTTLELMPSMMRYNVLVGRRAKWAATQAGPGGAVPG